MSKDSFKKVKFYKRQWVTNKDVQWSIIIYSVVLAMSTMSGYHLLLSMDQEATVSYGFIPYLLIFIYFTTIVGYGLYFTNRIAGPLYRMKIHMENLLENKDAPDLVFRKNDHFKELAVLLNKVVKKQKN